MTSKIATLVAAVMAVSLLSGSAMAQRLPNIIGSWSGMSNLSAFIIDITSEPSSGTCHKVSGSFENGQGTVIASLAGFYCPATGGFNFIRTVSGQTPEDYSGYVSNVPSPSSTITPLMAGVFSDSNGASVNGEYPFAANFIPPVPIPR